MQAFELTFIQIFCIFTTVILATFIGGILTLQFNSRYLNSNEHPNTRSRKSNKIPKKSIENINDKFTHGDKKLSIRFTPQNRPQSNPQSPYPFQQLPSHITHINNRNNQYGYNTYQQPPQPPQQQQHQAHPHPPAPYNLWSQNTNLLYNQQTPPQPPQLPSNSILNGYPYPPQLPTQQQHRQQQQQQQPQQPPQQQSQHFVNRTGGLTYAASQPLISHNQQLSSSIPDIPPAPYEIPIDSGNNPEKLNNKYTVSPNTAKLRSFTDLLEPNQQLNIIKQPDKQPITGNINDITRSRVNPMSPALNSPSLDNFTSSHHSEFSQINEIIMKAPQQISRPITEYKEELIGNHIIPNIIDDEDDIKINVKNTNKNNQSKNPSFFKNIPKIKIPSYSISGGSSIGPPVNLSPKQLHSPRSSSSATSSISIGSHQSNRQKIIIVCYKLPLTATYDTMTSEWNFKWEDIRNVLSNLRVLGKKNYDVNFVGWPGITPSTFQEQENLEDALYALKYPCYPVFLSEQQIRDCYKVYCRGILWPLFHYFLPTNDYQFGTKYESYWQSYVGLNNIYAKKACVASDTDDIAINLNNNNNVIIWFHDYHLLLAPHFVRRQIPLAQIGLFLHTTFPTSEVFRCLPTRKEILRGMLSADLLGFHTYDYARHFLSSCKRILDLDFHSLPHDGTLAVHYLGRDVSLRIGHASILSHKIHKTAESPSVQNLRKLWKEKLHLNANPIKNNDKKVILGFGELDEVHGTILTIQSFYQFLLNNSEWQNDIIFVLIISSCSGIDISPSSYLVTPVPKTKTTTTKINLDIDISTRTLERTRSYSNLRRPIDDEINKMKKQFNKNCIHLVDSNNLKHEELLALYTLADVAVFGTFWDGFNTVPYEFTAAQPSYDIYNNYDQTIDDDRGVPPAVILSEFMGCMRSLCGVFRVNPWKTTAVASTLHTALCMTSKERKVAHHRRFSHVMKYTFVHWAQGFLNDLKVAAKSEKDKRVLPIGFGSNLRFIYIPCDLQNLKSMQKLLYLGFKNCTYKILLFDFGGTLTDVDEMGGSNGDAGGKQHKDNSQQQTSSASPSMDYDQNDDEWLKNSNEASVSLRDLLGITKALQTISPKIIKKLQKLSSDPNTIVAIISGQTKDNLEKAFAGCPNLCLCAEKGAFFRWPGNGKNWVKNDKIPKDDNITKQWQKIVGDVLKVYTEKTNGSYVQTKSTALVWHYDNADPQYGDMQAVECERYLRRMVEKQFNLMVQRYDHSRILEILPNNIHKGSASLKVIDEMIKRIEIETNTQSNINNLNLNQNSFYKNKIQNPILSNNMFILAVGNDRSDEKMFESVELVTKQIKTEYGFTCRIGMGPTQARFYLSDQNQMLWLLNTLTSIKSPKNKVKKVPTRVNHNHAATDQLQGVSPATFNKIQNNYNMNGTGRSYERNKLSLKDAFINKPLPSNMQRRSYSYSAGLSAYAANAGNDNPSNANKTFQRRQPVENLNPHNSNQPYQYNQNNQTVFQQNKLLTPIQQVTSENSNTSSSNGNNDLYNSYNSYEISPVGYGGFFDNSNIRSNSYTSLSKLAKLAELNEQSTPHELINNNNRVTGYKDNSQNDKFGL